MIGAPLARRCLADGVAVHLLTRSQSLPTRLSAFGDEANIRRVDWNDANDMRRAVEAIAPRTIFHLAGIRLATTGTNFDLHLQSAVGLSASLLGALEDNRETAIVYASSGAVYGARLNASEQDAVEPASWLGATKAMAEQLFAAEARIHGRPLVNLRLFTPYGSDDESDRLIVAVIHAAYADRSLVLGSGSQQRDYVFIDDVTDAFIRAAELRPDSPATFNIGSGSSRSVRSVVDFILARMNRRGLARFGDRPDRPDDIPAMQANIGLAASRLAWAPRVAFADGIERMIAALSPFDELNRALESHRTMTK
jgi:UDP-glucose 4-epimerase